MGVIVRTRRPRTMQCSYARIISDEVTKCASCGPLLPLFAIGEIRDRHSCLRGLGFEFGRVVAMVV